MHHTTAIALTAAALLAPASIALAGDGHGHEDDIYLTILRGRITTGLLDDDHDHLRGGKFVRERVFGAEMGEDFPNFADEPGFDSAKGTFTLGTAIGFDLLGPLQVWNGSSFVVADNLAMEVAYGPESRVTGEGRVNGFGVNVDEDGEFHEHYDYTLLDNTPRGGIDGIFMISMQLWSTEAGVGRTLPFWIVFNQNTDDEIHDLAMDWVRDNVVPAPGAAALAGVVGLAGLRRRR